MLKSFITKYNKQMENTEKKEETLIILNGREYKSSDLNDQQRESALKLRVVVKQLNQLQDAHDLFVVLNGHKNELATSLEKSLDEKSSNENSEKNS